ncbi:hypothetical protein B9Z19DRAFT_61751 [Tuber borchii]|uniref:Uncharacterized protein n=1 Tax=Tuber borchii TaxID=42251 RepID=A0A2T6ZSW8_TUBBO|nr:hypothetical protein B9Z19DRAFT_61751 [Tuber borchii]
MLDKRSRIPSSKLRSLMLSELRTASTAIVLLLSIYSVSDVSLPQRGGKKEVEGANSHRYFSFSISLLTIFFLIKMKRDTRGVEIHLAQAVLYRGHPRQPIRHPGSPSTGSWI